MVTYRGTGGEPPASAGTGTLFKKPSYFFAEKVEGPDGPTMKKISPFKVAQGKSDVPVVVLDRVVDYAVRIHCRFKARGVFGNYAVCRSKIDDKGCPLDAALNEEHGGRWFLAMTVIDRSTWTQPSGKNKGKVWRDQRKLVLIPKPAVDEFEKIGEKVDGYRGAKFDVSRGSDQKSSRIGTMWFPDGKLSEDQLLSTFEKAAGEYGLPVEKFIEPIDYDKVLRPKSFEQLEVVAQEIVQDSSDLVDDATEDGAEDTISY